MDLNIKELWRKTCLHANGTFPWQKITKQTHLQSPYYKKSEVGQIHQQDNIFDLFLCLGQIFW